MSAIKKIFFLLLALSFAVSAQQITVAMLPSKILNASLTKTEEDALMDEMYKAALNVLPSTTFTMLNQDAVVKSLNGAESYYNIKECRTSSCIVDLGKKAQVDYIGKAVVRKLDGKLAFNVELYEVRTSSLVGVFKGKADNAHGLIALAGKNIPGIFRKISGASNTRDTPRIASPSVVVLEQNNRIDTAVSVKQSKQMEIGRSKEKVAAKPEHKQTVELTHNVASDGESVGNMVFVKGGTFTMGCTSEQGSECYDDEKPSRMVTVGDFYIGKYEVTQREWRDVMGSNPSGFSSCGDNCPVENISWNDAQEFIKRLNAKTGKRYRLPTEAEWEYASRGGSQSKGYKYSGSNNIDAVALYMSNSGRKIQPVGTKQANELGLHDMSGNVWEWVSDWHGNYSGSAASNPQGPSSGSYRVYRGGNWRSNAQRCRVTVRDYGHPPYRYNAVGLRLALSP